MIKWLRTRRTDFYLILHSCVCTALVFALARDVVRVAMHGGVDNILSVFIVSFGCGFSLYNIRHYRRRLLEFNVWVYEKGAQDFADHLSDCPSCRKVVSSGVAPSPHAAPHTLN